MIRIILIAFILLLVSGCSSTPQIDYKSELINIDDARNIAEEFTFTQHKNWRPDSLIISEKYIAWGYGTIQTSTSSAVAIGNTGVAIGDSTTRSRNVGERYYYHSIKKIDLLPWQRKFKQWYVVSITDKNNKRKYIFRTRNLDDAKLFTNAITTIVETYGNVTIEN